MFEDPRHFHFWFRCCWHPSHSWLTPRHRLATGAILWVVILPSLRVITRLVMRCQVSEGSEQRSNPTHMMGNPPLRLARTWSGDFKTSARGLWRNILEHTKKRFWSQQGRSGQTVAADLSGPELTGAPICPDESSLRLVVWTAWDCRLRIRGVCLASEVVMCN